MNVNDQQFKLVPSEHVRNGKPYFEVRCVPGHLIGHGTTLCQAVARVQFLLEWTADEETDFAAWCAEDVNQ